MPPILEFLKNWARDGLAVLIVEQQIDLALSIADRAMVIERGATTLSGTAEELKRDPHGTRRDSTSRASHPRSSPSLRSRKEQRALALERLPGIQADEILEQRAHAGSHTSHYVRGNIPKAGGGTRRLEAASYAEAISRMMSSLPGSPRNTSEKGSPGSGMVVGVFDGAGT